MISRYQEVIRRYPGTDAANQAASKLAGISTGEAKDPLAELAKKALILTKTNEFQQAIDLYQSYWDKTGDEKATAEIKKLNDEGDRAYRDLHQRAQAAISLGDKQRAREFYQEIKRHFGGTWTQQADSELSKIP